MTHKEALQALLNGARLRRPSGNEYYLEGENLIGETPTGRVQIAEILSNCELVLVKDLLS